MKHEESIEMRYYEVPLQPPLIALLGERWVLNYGNDPLHIHNHMEIGYCYYGDGTMNWGKEKREYSSGTITIIPANFPHSTKSQGDSFSKWEYLFIDTSRFIDIEYADKPTQAKHFRQCLSSDAMMLTRQESPVVGELILLILEEMRQKKEYYKESINGYLQALFTELVRKNHKADITQEIATVRVEDYITEVLNFIDTHYMDELKMGDLAEICHMSESYFRKSFAASMNVPPLEYVTLIRIEKACELLLESRDSLDTIGRKVGFPVTATFIRNFKKLIGISPGQWRTMVRKNDNILVNYKVSVRRGW